MAGLSDASSGDLTKVFFGTAGETDPASITTQIVDIESISTLEDTANIIEGRVLGGAYARKNVGSKSAGTIDVVVFWNPTDTGHAGMESAYVNKTKQSFCISMAEDETETNVTYAVFDGYVASKSIDNPGDGFRTAKFQIAIDGAYTISHKA